MQKFAGSVERRNINKTMLQRHFAKRRKRSKNMNNRKTNISNDEVVISLDNIERLSKILAISSLRDFEKYAYSNAKRIEILRKQLQKDIRHHNELDNYSDAYDIVQEASLFLLKFLKTWR